MYRIGEFSKMARVTVKTLRYYDEVGLLPPAFVDEENGYRYYTTEQLLPLHCIVSLRQAGLSVNEVRSVMSGHDVQGILQTRKTEIELELASVQQQLSRINMILQKDKEDYRMDYQAVLKDLPECIVYYKQGIVPTFADYSKFICQSGEECLAANPDIQCAEPDYGFLSYLDPDFRETNIRVEYAQAVTKAGKETETIHFKKIKAVSAVCVYHRGCYEGLREAYAFAYEWAEKNGYKQIESAREHYIDGIWNKENVEDWLTEIQIPVRQKR